MGCQEDFPLPSQYWKNQVERRCGIVAGCELLSAVCLLVEAAAIGLMWRIGKLDQSRKNSCRAVLLNAQSLVRTHMCLLKLPRLNGAGWFSFEQQAAASSLVIDPGLTGDGAS
jgi:hypothetical protein